MESRRAGAVVTVVAIAVVVCAALAVSTWYTCGFRGCPDVSKARGYIPEQASVILDRRGTEIARLYRANRRAVTLDSLPKYVPEAFVAVEDRRFFQHHGVDWDRVPGAVVANIRHRGFVQGFSTITMQLARNLFPDRLPAAEKNPLRKLSEMRVATAIEGRFSKQEILQMYLNEIYFGHGAWGIEAASEEYFGKPARQLTIAEAALLAGLPQSPSRSNPRADRHAAEARRNQVLQRMGGQGFITAAEAVEAKATPIRLRRGHDTAPLRQAPYFLEQVRQVLESHLGDAIYTDGLRIHTTLDLPTQKVAEAELERQLESIERGAYGSFPHPRYDPRLRTATDTAEQGPSYLQGALLMLDSQNGDVLAWVGGRDFAQSPYDHVAQAKRQPGSAFKPFVYTAAVAAGYPPTYQLLDRPLVMPLSRRHTWSPQNYDGVFKGVVSMVQALQESRNVPTVRLASDVGLDRVIQTARQMGIKEPLPYVPSLALGVADVTPYELICAYTAFSSLGNRAIPRLVTSVQDREGSEVWAQRSATERTIDPAVAFVMTTMLRRVVDRGTGTAVRAAGYRGPAAGKTGTTQARTDAWFVGYTPRLTMGIWLGFDRPTPITSRATGGVLAGPVWGRVMVRTAAASGGWTPPPGVERLLVTTDGAVLAGDCMAPRGSEPLYFVAGTAPATSGCQPGNVSAQGVVADSELADTTPTVPAAAEVGWWSRLRRRIFGGTETAGAASGSPARGQSSAPVPPDAVNRVPGAEVPSPQPPLDSALAGQSPTATGKPERTAQRPGGAHRPPPAESPDGGPPGAQPAPPPPDTAGGGVQ